MDDYRHIAEEILKMAEKDQKVRKDPKSTDANMIAVDNKNRNRMKDIIKEHGFISRTNFGKDASYMAWLLVQHFPPEEVEFMEKYLAMMELNKQDMDERNYAYLSDRICWYKGLPQTYGTQTTQGEDKKSYFYEIENIEKVDILRKSVGLNTLEDYSKMFSTPVVLPEDYIGGKY